MNGYQELREIHALAQEAIVIFDSADYPERSLIAKIREIAGCFPKIKESTPQAQEWHPIVPVWDSEKQERLTDQKFLIRHAKVYADMYGVSVEDMKLIRGRPRSRKTKPALLARYAVLRVAVGWGIKRKIAADFFCIKDWRNLSRKREPRCGRFFSYRLDPKES